jgi:hypothetical protein
MMKIDPRVYIYNLYDEEIEVDVELLEDGCKSGLNLTTGEEVTLTDSQIREARDMFMLLVEEYETYKSDYYNEW